MREVAEQVPIELVSPVLGNQIDIQPWKLHVDRIGSRRVDNLLRAGGIQVEARASTGASLGLLGMRERAALIDGTVDILSEPGKGCTVRLRCPWQPRTA